MKNYSWILLPIGIIMLALIAFDYNIKTWLIDKHLEKNTAIVNGELIRHEERSASKSIQRGISIVEFFVDGSSYYAEMDRLKVATGIKLKVKYNINNPKWHRVIVPDSLIKYHMPDFHYGEERYYTWPPTEPDGKRISKYDGLRRGPY